MCVTVDRFFSVCLPTKYKDIHTLKRARVAVTLSFISAIVFYTPMAFRKKIVPLSSTSSSLYGVKDKPEVVSNKAYKLYILFRECVCRFLPIVVLAILNVSIIVCFRRVVKKRERMLSGSVVNSRTTKKENKRFQEEKRLVILLIGIVFLFLCCITPSAVNMLFIRDDLETNFGYQVFRAAANILEFANSSLNFFVYCLCSSEIRGTLFNLFGIKTKRYATNPSQSRMSEDVQNAQSTRTSRFWQLKKPNEFNMTVTNSKSPCKTASVVWVVQNWADNLNPCQACKVPCATYGVRTWDSEINMVHERKQSCLILTFLLSWNEFYLKRVAKRLYLENIVAGEVGALFSVY